MYGLPADFDATIFIGRELEQVSFTVNTVRLAFADDVAITMESSFAFQAPGTEELVRQAPPVQASALMVLVGRKVCAARAENNGTLRLEFTAGGTLLCLDDSPQYESYHIWVGGKETIV